MLIMAKKKKANSLIGVKFTPEKKVEIQKVAEQMGLTVSGFIKLAAYELMKKQKQDL